MAESYKVPKHLLEAAAKVRAKPANPSTAETAKKKKGPSTKTPQELKGLKEKLVARRATTSASKAKTLPKPAITDKPVTHHEVEVQKVVDKDVSKVIEEAKKSAPKVPQTGSEARAAELKSYKGKVPAKLQMRVAAEMQQERHAPRMAHQKPSADFSVKDPKKVIKKLQPRVAAEAQQARHPRVPSQSYTPDWSPKRPELARTKRSVEQISAEAKRHKFQSRVKLKLEREGMPKADKPAVAPTPKGPSLKERIISRLKKAPAVQKAEQAVEQIPVGKIGKALRTAGSVATFLGKAGAATGGVTGAISIGEAGVQAHRASKAAKSLEKQAAHAEKKYGVKTTIKKPSILGTAVKSIGTLGMWEPEVKVDVESPKAPPLSEKAKKRLKSLGQM